MPNQEATNREVSRPTEQLVASDFSLQPIPDMEFAAQSEYPGYPLPSKRLTLSDEELATWTAKGRRTSDLPSRYPVIMNHPNYERGKQKGTSQIDDGTTDFSAYVFLPSYETEIYTRDERGIPIRQFDDIFLQKGAVGGFGFYRHYGPNRTADPVVFRQKDERLQVLLIERGDTGRVALPGGMQDPDVPHASTALHELSEEAGIDLSQTPYQTIHQGIVWSDTRATRNAWPETSVVLFTPDSTLTDDFIPRAGDDAAQAWWKDISESTLNQVLPSHAGFIQLSVLTWQKQTGLTILKDASISEKS